MAALLACRIYHETGQNYFKIALEHECHRSTVVFDIDISYDCHVIWDFLLRVPRSYFIPTEKKNYTRNAS